MTFRRLPRSRRSGYTLVEVLAASGLVASAIGAASALSMSMVQQEELTRGQAAAIRYAEAIARLWQLGIDSPDSVLLKQTQGAPGSSGYNPMTFNFSAVTTASLGNDGFNQGSVEQATVTVTYLPYGNADTAQKTIVLDVLRPAPSHR